MMERRHNSADNSQPLTALKFELNLPFFSFPWTFLNNVLNQLLTN